MQRLRIIKQILSSDTQTEVEKVRDDINNLIKTESNITNYNVDFLKTTESSLRTLSEEINNLFGTNETGFNSKLTAIQESINEMSQKINDASDDALDDASNNINRFDGRIDDDENMERRNLDERAQNRDKNEDPGSDNSERYERILEHHQNSVNTAVTWRQNP